MKNWSREFRCRTTTCEHVKGVGRRQTIGTQEIVDRVCEMIKQNCRLITRSLAEMTGFSNGIIGTITRW